MFLPQLSKELLSELPFRNAIYGLRIQAFLIYLRDYHYLPSERTVEFFQDVFQHTLSEGVIYQAEMNCNDHLEEFEKLLKNALKEAPLNHADKTTLRLKKIIGYMFYLILGQPIFIFTKNEVGGDG